MSENCPDRFGDKNPMYGKIVSVKTRRKLSKAGKGRKHSEETRLKMSEAAKIRPPISEETRRKMSEGNSGEKHPNWRGGIARLPYTYEFFKLRPEIIKRDNFTCQKCKRTEMELDYSLSVHHIDGDRDNNVESNLVSLCRSCHSKTNYNCDYWEKYFTGLMVARFGDAKLPIYEEVAV